MNLTVLTEEQRKLVENGLREEKFLGATVPHPNWQWHLLVSSLTDSLAAERARRESAEEVVDYINEHPKKHSEDWVHNMTLAHRQRFPKDKKL